MKKLMMTAMAFAALNVELPAVAQQGPALPDNGATCLAELEWSSESAICYFETRAQCQQMLVWLRMQNLGWVPASPRCEQQEGPFGSVYVGTFVTG